MKKIKKILVSVAFLLSCSLLFLHQVEAEQIDDFDVLIRINNDSSINVIEKIDYDFESLERHGIYRDISFKYNARGGRFRLGLSDFEVTDSAGGAYNFELSNQGNYKRIKVGDADKYVSGEKSYVISYKVERAINYFADHDELYWNVTGNEWEVPIGEARALIVFPDELDEADIAYDCFEGLMGSQEECSLKELEKSVNGQVVNVFFSSNSLESKSGLTFFVSFPKGVVYEPSRLEKVFGVIADNFILFLPIIVFLFLYNIWRRKGKDPAGRATVITQFDAPDDLSPAQVGALYDEVVNKQDISSLIISLAVKGFIKIQRIKDGAWIFKTDDYVFERLKEPENVKLDSYEKLMLDALFSSENIAKSLVDIKIGLDKVAKQDRNHIAYKLLSKLANFLESRQDSAKAVNKDLVKLSSLRNKFAKKYQGIEKAIYQSLLRKGYFPEDPSKVRNKYVAIGFVVIFFSFALGGFFQTVWGIISGSVSGLMFIIFGKFMPVKTAKGVTAQEHILGLKKYLEVAEKDRLKFHNAPDKNPQHFEKLLPYAIVLGVEKEWAKQFEGIYNEEPTWYTGSGSLSSVALVNSLDNFQTSTNTTMMSTASSGGSGSAGGSGGGGGGGGGGSW